MATGRGEHSEKELGSYLLGGRRIHSRCGCWSHCIFFFVISNTRESQGKTADTKDIIHQRVSLLGILPLPISQSNKHVKVEKDQEEKKAVKFRLIIFWNTTVFLFLFLNRDLSDESSRCSRRDTKRTKAGVWSLPSAVSIMLERLWPRLIPRTTALEGKSTLGPLETVATAVTSGGGVLFSERAAEHVTERDV